MDISHAEKVLIIGCPGSGKSTFARKLRDATGLPLYYLDRIFHRPDRTTVTRPEFDAALEGITSRDEWIIDGNYIRTLEMRLSVCDTVFFFDLPLEDCLAGAASRIGTVREDLPWVETELDPEFRQYIIDFPEQQLPEIRRLIGQAAAGRGIKVITFTSREAADQFISEVRS